MKKIQFFFLFFGSVEILSVVCLQYFTSLIEGKVTAQLEEGEVAYVCISLAFPDQISH